MTLHDEMTTLADHAVAASRALARLSTRKKNAILEAMAEELDLRRDAIKAANEIDMLAGREAGLSTAMLDRLHLTDARIDAMIKGLKDIVVLKDPVGQEISSWIRPNGLEIKKVRVPIGVIAIIYESRPNVTADAASLCFKTSNAVILRGGKESMHSNRAIAEALQEGGRKKGLPDHSIQLVKTTDRDAIRELVQMVGKVDLAIPRGGEGLINAVVEHARVPVIKHYKGVCHVYIDDSADLDMALDIVENAKCQRPGVCNAIETVLVSDLIAPEVLPRLADRLAEHNVLLRGDETARAIVPSMEPATEEDWYAEYLDLILAIRVVDGLEAAIHHINHYGSHHSDAIVARSEAAQKAFCQEVDSATVYVNASTRFTDGGEFGMGAEIGISTDKLHARGPMGLEELTTYKYVIHGTGQIR
ncbi:MAG TPA: glutamate-5-semialdehyde dehydrogenase [Kiritimatiellia bacterium]|nr:glutamate-5-semialdehyde dehydrogenase [Kiritimatiellia bacterium]